MSSEWLRWIWGQAKKTHVGNKQAGIGMTPDFDRMQFSERTNNGLRRWPHKSNTQLNCFLDLHERLFLI
jgi:hypothetical protein